MLDPREPTSQNSVVPAEKRRVMNVLTVFKKALKIKLCPNELIETKC